MSDDDRYIPGVPCWIDSSQPDPQAATAFYGGLFGWEFEDVMPPDAPSRYFVASLGDGAVGAIGSQPDGTSRTPVWDTYVRVASADETAAKVRAAGGKVLQEPYDVGPFGRSAVFADPAGATFCVWQAGDFMGAAVVNEPGSLNFNNLHTRDIEGAQAFYGAVFDWELIGITGTGGMWALAPYGDFLEQRRPGMREEMAAVDAPERFEDVVASLMPIADGDPDTAPHWSITLGVADADETARRAIELGGRVLVAPFDAPWVRMTVIRDPQGATFTASKFMPENRDLAVDG